MESNLQPEQELALAERAAVAPWIDYPPTPWWYEPSGGLLAGALVFVLGEQSNLPSAWYAIALVAVVAMLGAWVGVVVSRQGAVPRLRRAPAEFVPVIRAYFVGFALLLALVVTLYFVVDSRVAAVAAAVGASGGLYLYERRFAAAAAAVRKRVA